MHRGHQRSFGFLWKGGSVRSSLPLCIGFCLSSIACHRPGKLSVEPALVMLSAIGEKAQLRTVWSDADGRPAPSAGEAVHWRLSAPELADIDANGLVTAKRSGSVRVFAETPDQRRVSSADVMICIPARIVISSIDMNARGQKHPIEAVVYDDRDAVVPAGSQRIEYRIADRTVVHIEMDGFEQFIVADRVGRTRIQARFGNLSTEFFVTVTDRAETELISEPPFLLGLRSGQQGRVLAHVVADGRLSPDVLVTYESSNTAVVTVDRHGLYRAVGKGRARIEARAMDHLKTWAVVVR